MTRNTRHHSMIAGRKTARNNLISLSEKLAKRCWIFKYQSQCNPVTRSKTLLTSALRSSQIVNQRWHEKGSGYSSRIAAKQRSGKFKITAPAEVQMQRKRNSRGNCLLVLPAH